MERPGIHGGSHGGSHHSVAMGDRLSPGLGRPRHHHGEHAVPERGGHLRCIDVGREPETAGKRPVSPFTPKEAFVPPLGDLPLLTPQGDDSTSWCLGRGRLQVLIDEPPGRPVQRPVILTQGIGHAIAAAAPPRPAALVKPRHGCDLCEAGVPTSESERKGRRLSLCQRAAELSGSAVGSSPGSAVSHRRPQSGMLRSMPSRSTSAGPHSSPRRRDRSRVAGLRAVAHA